jgi:D-alanyl-D-alanine carboxypeptidase/D-alanyl-D-alanine-endopeptidase (penicillin-binding protein 4)
VTGSAVSLSRRSFLVALGALSLSEGALAAEESSPLATELLSVERWASEKGGHLGVCFLDLATGKVLGAVAPGELVNPASNQKLVTTGAALHYLGATHVFTTGLYGKIEAGSVAELVLRGDGDPSLTSADLALLSAELRKCGVSAVGDISIDQSAFDDEYVPPGFEQQPEEWAAFRAPVSAVAVDRNSVFVSVVPGRAGEPARVSFEPSGFVDVDGEIMSVKKGKRAVPRVGMLSRGQRLAARLGGNIVEGSPALRYRQRVDDPRLLAGYALRSALATAGIAVGGVVQLGGARERREIAVHRSSPLSQLLPELGKESDNFYAEMLVRAVGMKLGGRPATSSKGSAGLVAWLKQIDAWESGSRITNGSGLFDSNRLCPRTLTRLLAHVAHDPGMAGDFLPSLAVGGVDGTLRNRFRAFATERAVLGKTGTLRDVVALSGYVLDGKEPKVAFSAVMTGVAGRTGGARRRIDRLVELAVKDVRRKQRGPIS